MGTPENGGARRDRTVDLLHAMQALSQLSYGPVAEGPNCREDEPYCQRLGGETRIPALFSMRRRWWRHSGAAASGQPRRLLCQGECCRDDAQAATAVLPRQAGNRVVESP
jgi:hypothetical protein